MSSTKYTPAIQALIDAGMDTPTHLRHIDMIAGAAPADLLALVRAAREDGTPEAAIEEASGYRYQPPVKNYGPLTKKKFSKR